MAFFASIVVDAEWLRLKKEIAWLNGPLGAARDSDVVVEYARRKRYGAWARRMIGEQLDRAPDAGSPPPGSLPAFRSYATSDRGNGGLDQAGTMAGAL